MPAKKTNSEQKKKIEEAQEAISDITKIIGKGINEVWKIFVRKNIVFGISLVFAAFCMLAAVIAISVGVKFSIPSIILLIISGLLIVVAINFIGNSSYLAMEDTINKVKNITENNNKNTVEVCKLCEQKQPERKTSSDSWY